ncbi:MAG TPA: ATP-binding protein, partial [Candidatus Binataceae bacterium]
VSSENLKWAGAVDAALGALEHQPIAPEGPGGTPELEQFVLMGPAELRAIRGAPRDSSISVYGFAANAGGGAIGIRAAIAGDAAAAAIKAALELFARAALAIVTAAHLEDSRCFWRERAASSAHELELLRSSVDQNAAAAHESAALLEAITKLSAPNRFQDLGAMLARAAGADAWMIAAAAEGALEVRAFSAGLAPPAALDQSSALALSWRRREIIENGGALNFHEDRIFERPFICVPFENASFAAGSRRGIAPPARAKLRALAPRLSIILRAWLLEEQLARQRALVQRLALRMFAAVDEERARIARDLHDDQAQLIAAAKMALEGGRDEARGIFVQLENELRSRIRELRPATLGLNPLSEALRRELDRLSAAGLKTRLAGKNAADRLPASLQNLCFQVAREALANVARHSGATSVEVTLEHSGRFARLTVCDDGRGNETAAGSGSGLAGIRERLELMGGTVSLDFKSAGTTLIAEIPVPA